jgi:hypothetical protein
MNDFLINFSANLLADVILAIAILIAITRPGERRRTEENFKQALSLLQTEININVERSNKYIQALSDPPDDINDLLPLRYSRGAWNSLKESNFLPKINNAELVYYLLRMNETALVANKNLRKFELSYLEDTKGDKEKIAGVARSESIHLNKIFVKVAEILEKMKLPSFEVDELFLEEESEDEEE